MGKKPSIEEPEALTAKKSDFSTWYNQILSVAGILDKRYDVKGMYVWLPYGYDIMLRLKGYWDVFFKEAGIKETYFPLIVPLSYAEINKSWFDGFKDEAFWVGGRHEKEFTHILRPTGEPAMYPMFKTWIRTHGDLPLRIYETVSSFRYETKHTRPIIRDREITMWFEIHTAHATQKEAEKEAELHKKLYSQLWDVLALPYLRMKKPAWESFPGSVGAIEDYTIMPTGKAMENGSINILGQAYAKAFDITFKDAKGKDKHVWQVCTGNGARYLAAALAVHGDDRGLVLPPKIAPIQVVVVPIYKEKDKTNVLKKARALAEHLKKEDCVRVELDEREITPGSKFYDWELKGVPVRLEIGPRDIQQNTVKLVRRDTGKKEDVKELQLHKHLFSLLDTIQKDMYTRANNHFKDHLIFVKKLGDIKKHVQNNNVVSGFWCGTEKCYDTIQQQDDGLDPFGTDLKNKKEGPCLVCGKKTKELLYVSNTY
jgi:prolyl-tRNA synthetase